MRGTSFTRLVLGLSLGLALAAAVNAGMPPDVPSRIYSSNPAAASPIWVSARDAVDADGKLDPEALDKASRESLERFSRSQAERRAQGKAPKPEQAAGFSAVDPSECELSVLEFRDTEQSFKARGSLDDLLSHAQAIYSGRIVAIEQGFFLGSPSSLLKVEVNQALRASAKFHAKPFLYVQYPFAAFRLGGTVHCAENLHFPSPVQVGDRILAFAYSPPLDKEGSLISLEAEMMLVERQDGRLVLPQRLRKDVHLRTAGGLSEVEALILQRAASQGSGTE